MPEPCPLSRSHAQMLSLSLRNNAHATVNYERSRAVRQIWTPTANGSQILHSSSYNKAVFTAALVADGWAGAEKVETQLCDRPTDGPKSIL